MTELKVSSYVTVRDRCPMRYRVVDDAVEFSFGGARDPFEFVFDARSLREFLRVGTTALREIGAREIGTREIGTREIGTREIGTREIGARETGEREMDGRGQASAE